MDRKANIHSNELAEYFFRLNNALTEKQFWKTVFTQEERIHIETTPDLVERLKEENGMFDVYCVVRRKSTNSGVIDLSHELGLMTELVRKRLSKEIHSGSSSQPAITNDCPAWFRETGKLFWGKLLIRQVRLGVASNSVLVLDGFQEHDWKERIDNPLPSKSNNQQLYETIRTLNQRLKRIRFSADGQGTGVMWRRAK